MSARFIVADVFAGLATLDDNSVDLVMSSPPFLALRSYLPADHPDKGKEIGPETTPAGFLDTLLDVVEACDRVLAPHGSLCFELGDSYSGGSAEGTDARNEAAGGWTEHRGRSSGCDVVKLGAGWPEAKSLCGIPTLFAWSLAYGRNLLRPERETPRWRIRNLIVWARPNPPVGALGDKFRPATSYLTVAAKSRTRYFDLDAVRTPGTDPDRTQVVAGARVAPERFGERETAGKVMEQNPAGAPPLDYWVIPTQPYKSAHYAAFPEALCVKPIAAMSPARVCRVCGEPSRRIVEVDGLSGADFLGKGNDRDIGLQGPHPPMPEITRETLGWTDCGHDDWRPGHVLDPFAGSGTVGAVATGHGRDATLIDLDERNADLALERVGPMFLTVEHLTEEGAA